MDKSVYRSRISEAVHTTMQDLYDYGLADIETMRQFDKSCLTPISAFSPQDVSDLRAREGVSQGVFAYCLNVKPKLVSEWERGTKKQVAPL